MAPLPPPPSPPPSLLLPSLLPSIPFRPSLSSIHFSPSTTQKWLLFNVEVTQWLTSIPLSTHLFPSLPLPFPSHPLPSLFPSFPLFFLRWHTNLDSSFLQSISVHSLSPFHTSSLFSSPLQSFSFSLVHFTPSSIPPPPSSQLRSSLFL